MYKATDDAFAKSISFWATPRKECLNGKGSDCVPFVRLDQGLDRDQGLIAVWSAGRDRVSRAQPTRTVDR